VLVLASVMCLAACLIRHKGPSRKVVQRHNLALITPVPLESTNPWKGEPRELKVRVYLDEDFRAQTMHWKQQIEEQFDDANQFLVPALGIRLEIVSYEMWEQRSASMSMGELAAALAAHDPGDDVAWVVGYVSSLSVASSSFEQLGVAQLLGKHVVIRGYADSGERKQLAEAFPKVPAVERNAAFDARRRHKQTVVLIHEIAHTLGAIHELDAGWIMHATYDIEMSQFSDRSRELMQISIDERLKPKSEQDNAALAGRLIGYLDANPWGGWDEEEKTELATMLRATMDNAANGASGGVAGNGGAGPDVPVPAAAYDQFKHAQGLAAKGKSAEALAELEALVAAYPGTAEIRQAICEVQIGAKGPGSDEATAACTRASEITPDDPRPYVARVEAYLRAGDRAHALSLVGKIEERAGDRAPVWDRVAEIYQATGRVTFTEAAAKHSMEIQKATTHPLLEWAARTRARYGLPPDGKRWKIKPDDEGEYIAAVRELLDLIYAGKTAEAEGKARAAEKRWKGAPGILGARCDLHLRLGERGTAKKLCAQAIAGWKGAAWAQYLEGVMAIQEHKDAQAEVSLRAAIAADPELGQAYRALGKALQRAKNDAAWKTLADEYVRRFGQPLPK
jgi:tetratricopeptide (TPR) repeat protein